MNRALASSAGNRVVFITGANEGIGYHVLRALVDEGYRVAGLDINVEQLRPLRDAHPNHVRLYRCDVTSADDVETAIDAVLDAWGKIDVLVNNAAIFNFGFFGDRTLDATRQEFEVNFFGYPRLIRAVLPHMRARNEGIIHNVSSGVGLVGNPGLSGYAATKGAIEALTRSLQLELRHENVSCTIVHPRLANTRSAATIFPAPTPGMSDPADVGRKLAGKIESTRPVIYADWPTEIGLVLARRFPSIVRRGTQRFLEEHEETANRPS